MSARNIFLLFLLSFSILSCAEKEKVYPYFENNTLVIYSPHSEILTADIIREFRQRTLINVEVVRGGTGNLLSRLEEDTNSGKKCADVFWGGGVESLEASSFLFDEYESSESSFVKEECKGKTWTAFSVMTMVIVYNKALVGEQKIPRKWSDLTDEFFDGRFFIPDPEKSGSAYSMLNAILLSSYPEENWSLLSRIKKSSSKPGLAERAPGVHTAVASGEYFAGFTSEDAALSFLEKDAEERIAISYPEDGTLAVPDGIAKVKNAMHSKEAELFIDFALSKSVQEYVSTFWCRRSVRKDVTLPKNAKPVEELNLLPYDIYSAAQNRERRLKMWREL